MHGKNCKFCLILKAFQQKNLRSSEVHIMKEFCKSRNVRLNVISNVVSAVSNKRNDSSLKDSTLFTTSEEH